MRQMLQPNWQRSLNPVQVFATALLRLPCLWLLNQHLAPSSPTLFLNAYRSKYCQTCYNFRCQVVRPKTDAAAGACGMEFERCLGGSNPQLVPQTCVPQQALSWSTLCLLSCLCLRQSCCAAALRLVHGPTGLQTGFGASTLYTLMHLHCVLAGVSTLYTLKHLLCGSRCNTKVQVWSDRDLCSASSIFFSCITAQHFTVACPHALCCAPCCLDSLRLGGFLFTGTVLLTGQMHCF